MASTLSPRLLYAGVALFVVLGAVTARSVWRAFEARAGQAQAAGVFDLVATRTPMRPSDAPGAVAWLQRAIDRLAADTGDTSLAEPADAIPPVLSAAASAIPSSSASRASSRRALSFDVVDRPGITAARRQFLLVGADRTLAVTERATAGNRSRVNESAAALIQADASLHATLAERPLPRALGGRALHPVRLYVVDEDGTLVSLPWVQTSTAPAARAAAETESRLLGARPTVPAFAPEEFFFRASTEAYSGLYLDLGGRGLVATITRPEIVDGRIARVFALDVAFDVDWNQLAGSLGASVVGAAATVSSAVAPTWAQLAAALPTADGVFRAALAEAALRAPGGFDTPTMRQAVVPGGALVAFHVAEDTWLVAWFPQRPPTFPFAATSLLGAVLVVLLVGFEVNRRRADRARRAAERALNEKQNLLNTMKVPLVVVDPNTDEIVSANEAADAIGFRAGRRFPDLVWPDARARGYYERTQIATPEPRRAYGVPVAVTAPDGKIVQRYAIVRSVAVTAPIDALNADERHRLGILILIDDEADLALFADDLAADAHRDERRRLAGLLTHGVDTLARVLEHALARRADPAFVRWLAEYLERRIRVTAWLLEHWEVPSTTRDLGDATADAARGWAHLPREHVIDASQAQATIARLAQVLAVVAADRELRTRLHWDNGTLAQRADVEASTDRDDASVLRAKIDWPDDVDVACPVRGGFGLFVNELVANAVRHGRPGTAPAIVITCDRVRAELACTITNTLAGPASLDRADAYSGVAIVKAMARLFDWRDLAWTERGDTLAVRWTMPFGTRRAGEAD